MGASLVSAGRDDVHGPVPEELVPGFLDAVTDFQRGAFQDAIEHYDQILSMPQLDHRRRLHALFGKALSFSRLEEFGKAESGFMQVLEEAEGDRRFIARASFRLGNVKRKSGKLDEALEIFQRLQGTFPELSGIQRRALEGMSHVYLLQQDRARFYETMHRLDRDHLYSVHARKISTGLFLRGMLQFKDYESAIALGQAIIARYPSASVYFPFMKRLVVLEAHLALANAYVATDKPDKARRSYRDYVTMSRLLFPDSQEPLRFLGLQEDARLADL